MRNPDRLTGPDASLLALEDGRTHMHLGELAVLDGRPPAYVDLLAHVEQRLHLVPRYRRKLAHVPLQSHRPVWIDDPHFNARYHVRHTALPAPGGDDELRRLCGRLLSLELDRSKPLWEMWLVEGLQGDRWALITKTHDCLVDGASGLDIATTLFDAEPAPPPATVPDRPWFPRPEPSSAALLADALAERATAPGDALRGALQSIADPVSSGAAFTRATRGISSLLRASTVDRAPETPINARIGPHRRFAWVEAELADFRAAKDALGGSVNDIVLGAVCGALRTFLLRRGFPLDGVQLRAMVPLSVTADEHGGTDVRRRYAVLPVDVADPVERLALIRASLEAVTGAGRAVGAELLTQLSGFAPPTVLGQAARLQRSQRTVNLTITNVPGPQTPRYLLGSRLRSAFPQMPLQGHLGLSIALMSYDGRMDFGLVGDYDLLPDLDDLADDLEAAIAELSLAGAPS